MAVLGAEESAGEVVLVPPGQDQHHRCTRRETRRRGVRPPVPHGLPVHLGVGLLAVLDRVVDHQQVDGAAGETTTDADGVDPAVVPGELPLGLCGHVVADPDAEFGVVADVVADGAAPPAGDAVFVGGDRDAGVGAFGQQPGGEPARGALRLALLWGHHDDESPVGGVGELDERLVDELERRGLHGAGVERDGHLAGGAPLRAAVGQVRFEGVAEPRCDGHRGSLAMWARSRSDFAKSSRRPMRSSANSW